MGPLAAFFWPRFRPGPAVARAWLQKDAHFLPTKFPEYPIFETGPGALSHTCCARSIDVRQESTYIFCAILG